MTRMSKSLPMRARVRQIGTDPGNLSRNKFRAEIIIQVLSIGGGFLVHIFFHRWDIALVVTLALECFLHFVAMMWLYGQVLDRLAEWIQGSENPIEDIRHMRHHTIPMSHVAPPPTEWPFNELFREAVVDFQSRITLISEGDCTIKMEDILDVSLRVPEFVEAGAFCTALEENLKIFDTVRGKDLLTRQHEAAKRLALQSGTETGFTRLFIFDDLASVTWGHYKLLEKGRGECYRSAGC